MAYSTHSCDCCNPILSVFCTAIIVRGQVRGARITVMAYDSIKNYTEMAPQAFPNAFSSLFLTFSAFEEAVTK